MISAAPPPAAVSPGCRLLAGLEECPPAADPGHIAAHLIREQRWRLTGDWAGAEAPHDGDMGRETAGRAAPYGPGPRPDELLATAAERAQRTRAG